MGGPLPRALILPRVLILSAAKDPIKPTEAHLERHPFRHGKDSRDTHPSEGWARDGGLTPALILTLSVVEGEGSH